MKTVQQHCLLFWARLSEDSTTEFGEQVFHGGLDEAVTELQSRVNRGDVFFGQVAEADGKIYKNIAAQDRPTSDGGIS